MVKRGEKNSGTSIGGGKKLHLLKGERHIILVHCLRFLRIQIVHFNHELETIGEHEVINVSYSDFYYVSSHPI